MKIELDTPLYHGGREDPHDVRQVKRALGCLGFYVPDPHTGMTGEADPGFWSGLHAFQRVHTVPFDDVAGPGSVTERVMNEELAALERGGARYVWRTVGDDKVRGAHATRAGRIFYWHEELDGGHPGEDYNCRCWAEPLNPARHPLAAQARAAQMQTHAMTTGAMGMPVPESSMPPEFQEVSASTLVWNGARMTVAACWGNKACRGWLLREGAKIVLENSHHIPPKDLPAFPDAELSPRRGQRKRWVDSKGKIYEWDYKKGEVEIYDKTGKNHEGGFDPNTGKRRSPEDKRKRAEK